MENTPQKEMLFILIELRSFSFKISLLLSLCLAEMKNGNAKKNITKTNWFSHLTTLTVSLQTSSVFNVNKEYMVI